jgi:hypothetical protein
MAKVKRCAEQECGPPEAIAASLSLPAPCTPERLTPTRVVETVIPLSHKPPRDEQLFFGRRLEKSQYFPFWSRRPGSDCWQGGLPDE